jgi:NAD(P)-dependent dehydrogenase (short-subunit alcohol dehydrogenase family)
MSDAPVTVVTGANSGIGRATALHLAESGHTVYATVRAVSKAGKLLDGAEALGVGVELVELDVAADHSVRDGFAEIYERAGHIDHLVNNAGVGGNGVVEETTPARFMEVFDVDLCGVVRCAQAVLPRMRAHGSGTIVNVSSVVGRFGAIAQAPYVAAKWALEGVSEQMALELAPFGIRVAIIEPGITKSSIFGKNLDLPDTSGAYSPAYERMMQMYAAGRVHATDAIEVARVVRHAIESGDPTLRYPVSWGSDAIIVGRQKMSDAEWLALGRTASMPDYIAAFSAAFGIDIST